MQRNILAVVATLAMASPACAQPLVHAPASIIGEVPRGGSVDVPLSMDSTVRAVRPLTMTGETGRRQFVTQHSGVFGGKRVDYQVKVGETVIRKDGKPVASLFNAAYLATNMGDAAKRPVVVLFNGGPGGSSAPLRFSGAWSPKRLTSLISADLGDPANVLIDNPDSPLDAFDMIFLDPPDTGYSRSAPGQVDLFRSVDGDSEAVSLFVATWLKDNGRLNSPVYIAGESYGTLRVVAMARDLLMTEPKVKIDGVIMIGSAPTFGQNGRTPNPLFIAAEAPMMASVAWHYGKIDNKGQTWDQAVQKARDFGRKEWLPALTAGHDISQAEFDRVAQGLSETIGVPVEHFRQNRSLTVDFNRTLLADRKLVLDRNNGLETTPARPPGAPSPPSAYEAMGKKIDALYAADFKVAGLGEYWYASPSMDGVKDWNFMTTGAPALDVTLSRFLKANPDVRFMVMQGRYDTLTDMGTTEYIMAQTDLPRDRYFINYYEGGHLLANTPESNRNLRAFVSGQ